LISKCFYYAHTLLCLFTAVAKARVVDGIFRGAFYRGMLNGVTRGPGSACARVASLPER